ncbi:MAG: hypothetical protein R3D71_06490 [Rickettsiales bacterium]
MTDTDDKKPDPTRTIVLVYGMLENGHPFWVYVAVKSKLYPAFLKAQRDGTLNLYRFEDYGEIIVSGAGNSPPDEVTIKVAEMYQTDANKLKERIESDD